MSICYHDNNFGRIQVPVVSMDMDILMDILMVILMDMHIVIHIHMGMDMAIIPIVLQKRHQRQ